MRNYSYKLVTAPINTLFILDDIKNYLRLDTGDTSEDNLLLSFQSSAVSFIEKYTNRTLLTTTFKTYRDVFFNSQNCSYFDRYGYDYWELRKSPLQSISSIKYFNKSNVLVTVDTNIYYNTLEDIYSKILLNYSLKFPSDASNKLQAIEIEFIAGYGDDATSVPDELKNAVLMLISAMYENRGDCIQSTCSQLANGSIKQLISQFRVINI